MSTQPPLWEGFEFEPEQRQPDPQISDLARSVPASPVPRRRTAEELVSFARAKITPAETLESQFPRIDHPANQRYARPKHISELLPAEAWIEEMYARVMPKLSADEAKWIAENGPRPVPAPSAREMRMSENDRVMLDWIDRNQHRHESRSACAQRWYKERAEARTPPPEEKAGWKPAGWKPAGRKAMPTHYQQREPGEE